jgi:hypothetical protein
MPPKKAYLPHRFQPPFTPPSFSQSTPDWRNSPCSSLSTSHTGRACVVMMSPKCKVHPCTGTEALYRPYAYRESRGIALPFLDHGTRRGWEVSVTPRPLFTPEKTRYPLYRRLGGPQDRSGQVRKISPPPGLDPRTVQPVASRYTDYATRPTDVLKVVVISEVSVECLQMYLNNKCGHRSNCI